MTSSTWLKGFNPLTRTASLPCRTPSGAHREDVVTEHNNREENMKNAPDEVDGLFLVPKVIE
jgi:aspartyl/glutamyl-tRNA(Asn/Gln) amidotransferase C subunit